MLEVAASELELINAARAIVGLGDPSLLAARACTLSSASPACMRILRETLAAGCVQRLAMGGWRRRDRIRDGERVGGRLWERHRPPKLEFTQATETLLRWLTSNNLLVKCPPLNSGPQTPADDFFFYLAMRWAADAGVGELLAFQLAFRSSPLCWLGFPKLFILSSDVAAEVPEMSWLTDGVIVEALQDELAHRWLAVELEKQDETDGKRMGRLGEAQALVLSSFLAAVARAGRRDLARFVVVAATRLAELRPVGTEWLDKLSHGSKLSTRSAAREAACAFLGQLETVAGWVEVARSTSFIDDDYAEAQILLEIWEMLGNLRLAQLRQLRRDAMSFASAPESTASEPKP